MAQKLMRYGATYHRLQEEHCNGTCRFCKVDVVCEKEIRIELHIMDLIGNAEIPASIKFGGDPRGCTVKLVFLSGRTNDFGAEGVIVPGA